MGRYNVGLTIPFNQWPSPVGVFQEFGTDMTFWQRTVNFLATGVMWGARDFYVLSRAEQTLDKLFPGEQR